MRSSHGAAVLDVGAGTGRLAAQSSVAGIDLVGVDREPAVLTVARKRTGGRIIIIIVVGEVNPRINSFCEIRAQAALSALVCFCR